MPWCPRQERGVWGLEPAAAADASNSIVRYLQTQRRCSLDTAPQLRDGQAKTPQFADKLAKGAAGSETSR